MNFPSSAVQTQDYDGLRDNQAVVNLTTSLATVDFGYQPLGTGAIGNLVWLDTNNNGVKDSTESGIDGVTVQLYRSTQTPGVDTPYASTTTAGGGLYGFSSLPATTWVVYIPAANFTGVGALVGTPLSNTTTTANNISGSTVSNTSTSVTQQLSITSANVTHVDFMFNSTVNYDFGDLPLSYGMTTLAQDGARHIIPGGGSTVYLGTTPPDAEIDGQPTALANGDDLSGSDDEDGVVAYLPATWSDGTVASGHGGRIQVTVNGSGWLVGWIDWNHNSSFLDASEMVVSQAVSTGVYTLSFDIPAGTISAGVSQSWLSRFRVFTAAPTLPLYSFTGEATDGEVEDHLLEKLVAGSIGDLVWSDANNNGVVEAGEPGLGGATVVLRNASNVIVGTQVTSDGTVDVDGDGIIDPLGYYRFRGLAAGTYTVTVTPPSGYNPSYDENGVTTPRPWTP